MPNLRIVSDNAVDRAASLVASTTAGALAASNMANDRKSSVWRSTVTTATTITATWAAGELLSCVALAPCNFSAVATIRVQLYDATSGGTLLLDTNTLQPGALACPAPAIVLRGFTAAAAANAYGQGGGAYARIWFAPTAGVKRMVVTVSDAGNLQGFRMIWGEFSSWLTARQDHRHEVERMRLQGELDAAAHARNLDSIRVQADLGVKTIQVQAEADIGRIEADGWLAAVKGTATPTGVWFVDLWNGVIRPAVATWSVAMVSGHYFHWWVLDENGWALTGAALGIYLADRALFKRGK